MNVAHSCLCAELASIDQVQERLHEAPREGKQFAAQANKGQCALEFVFVACHVVEFRLKKTEWALELLLKSTITNKFMKKKQLTGEVRDLFYCPQFPG